jgi:RHS repeat-associated protein
MIWDHKDELKEVTLNASGDKAYYVYDASGERIRKVIEKTGGIVEQRIYLGGWEVYRKTISGSLDYERETLRIMDDRKAIANVETKTVKDAREVDEPSVIRYQYDNHLGSACLELDVNAAFISYEEYHPFGTTSYRSGRTETEVSMKRYEYVGKERDEETGLYYYGARYYAGWLARFMSVDTMAGKFPFYTPYQYSGNNPITFYDLDGTETTANEVANIKPNGQQENSQNFTIPKYSKENPIKADNTNLQFPDPQIIDRKLNPPKNPFNIVGLDNSEQNIPIIGPYNPNGWSEDFLQANRKQMEFQHKYDEFIETGQATNPVLFGGNGFGIGLARDPFVQGVAQGLLLEGAIFPMMSKAGGVLLWGTGRLLPKTTRLGEVARSFEGIPSLNYAFNKTVIKYTPGEFYPFNLKGISYKTDLTTGSSIEAYQSLSLGFQTHKGSINPISTSYDIYSQPLRGFYLSGKIGSQSSTLGGANQFVGAKWFTRFPQPAIKIGRTTLGGN